MDHGPDPGRLALVAGARVWIIRGLERLGGPGPCRLRLEPYPRRRGVSRARRLCREAFVVVVPRPAQRVHARQLPQARERFCGIQRVKQRLPILTDRLHRGIAWGVLPRQTGLLTPLAGALIPRQRGDTLPPGGCDRGQGSERRAPRLRHAFQPMADTHGGEHLRGVCTLLAAGREPSEGTTPLQQFVQ
jgi:hypothetical protein